MDIDKLLESHFNSSLETEILNYFDYQMNWRYLPLVDDRDRYWSVSYDQVYYQDEPLTELGDGLYGSRVIGEPHRKGDYVLIAYDTECDGNQYLGVFRADKEFKGSNE